MNDVVSTQLLYRVYDKPLQKEQPALVTAHRRLLAVPDHVRKIGI